MSEKKVVAFIVEGPSDEAAIGSVMKEFFYEQIERVKSRYRYVNNDFLKIIHIADTDGVYISEADIREEDVGVIRYCSDHIEAKNVRKVMERNKRKGDILYKLRKTGKINGIPYRIYFNSCNLEHVLYGELKDYSDEEKQMLSDDFADRYDGKANGFIDFISAPEIAVSGTYQKTWDYIEKDTNSLNRHTNMHLIFE